MEGREFVDKRGDNWTVSPFTLVRRRKNGRLEQLRLSTVKSVQTYRPGLWGQRNAVSLVVKERVNDSWFVKFETQDQAESFVNAVQAAR